MRYVALVIFSLIMATPVSAQYSGLRPRGAVPLLDGCNGMSGYPDCHPDRGNIIIEGRSVAVPPHPGIRMVPPYPPGTQFYPAYGR